jgi:RNA polymerase sigma-70 factor (sigma-E family)
VGDERSIISVEMERAETQRGDRLGELYLRHAPDGIRLAYLLTGDRALAEDLVQEAFARFVGRLLHLRNPDAFEPYLRRTIVNLSRSHFRHRRVEARYLQRIAWSPERSSTDSDEHGDLDEAMHEAVLRLPARQRAAIVLRFYEDLSDAQTAEVLKCRPGTVRSLVSRGMTTLRAELAGARR